MTLNDKITEMLKKRMLDEAFPGMGRNQEHEAPAQGSSKRPPVEVLSRGVKGGSTPNKSAAPLAAGAGPMDKTPPKQGDSKDADVEELDPNAVGKSAGAKKGKMPVPTATGAGKAKNFGDALDPVAAVAARATKGNVATESVEDELETVEEVDETEELDVEKEMEALFADEEGLPESFKVKAAQLFATLVEARVAFEVQQIEEDMAEVATQRIEEHCEALEEQLDAYMNRIVEDFIEENEVAITETLRLEIAENFMERLRDVFEESYIDIPAERFDVVAALEEKVGALEATLAEAAEAIDAAESELVEAKRQIVFDEMTEGLTDVDCQKLSRLIESISFEDEATFAEKIKVIKENYLSRDTQKSTVTSPVVEDEEYAGDVKEVSAGMKKYVDAIGKSVQK